MSEQCQDKEKPNINGDRCESTSAALNLPSNLKVDSSEHKKDLNKDDCLNKGDHLSTQKYIDADRKIISRAEERTKDKDIPSIKIGNICIPIKPITGYIAFGWLLGAALASYFLLFSR